MCMWPTANLSTHKNWRRRLGVHRQRQHRSVLRLLCNSGPVPDMPTFPPRIPRVWPLEHPFGRYRHHVSVTQSHATQVQGKRSNGGCAPTPHRSCTKKEQLPASPYLQYRTPRIWTRGMSASLSVGILRWHGLNSGGGQLLQPSDLERFCPTRPQVMFLRRMRFHACILVRRPAVLALSCGIEQHDAAAVHF